MGEDISDRDLAAKAVRGDGLALREFAVEKIAARDWCGGECHAGGELNVEWVFASVSHAPGRCGGARHFLNAQVCAARDG